MSVAPTLTRTAEQGIALTPCATGYWSPDALGMNGVALASGASFASSPFLVTPGLNSFMLIYIMPDVIQGSVSVSIQDPRGSPLSAVFIESPGGFIGGGTVLATFGAFSTEFLDGPFLSPPAVWWVFVLTFENDDAFTSTTLTAHLFGGRR